MCIHNLRVSVGLKRDWEQPVKVKEMYSRQSVLDELSKCGIQPISLGTLLDTDIALTTKRELDRIAPALVYPADWYIKEIADCEDYGMKAQVDAAFNLHVSGVRLALGWMPDGYHGFVITVDLDGNIWWLEPNAGFEVAGRWHRLGDGDYRPDKVLL